MAQDDTVSSRGFALRGFVPWASAFCFVPVGLRAAMAFRSEAKYQGFSVHVADARALERGRALLAEVRLGRRKCAVLWESQRSVDQGIYLDWKEACQFPAGYNWYKRAFAALGDGWDLFWVVGHPRGFDAKNIEEQPLVPETLGHEQRMRRLRPPPGLSLPTKPPGVWLSGHAAPQPGPSGQAPALGVSPLAVATPVPRFRAEAICHTPCLKLLAGSTVLRATSRFYTLGAGLGQGVFGEVVQARFGDELVAVKTLKKQTNPRTLTAPVGIEEVYVLDRCRGHPHLVQLLDVFEDSQGRTNLVCAHGGKDLAAIVKDAGRGLEPLAVRQVVGGTLQALRHLHSIGVIHADVKPANILCRGLGVAGASCRLADLGCAVPACKGKHVLTHTQTYHNMAHSNTQVMHAHITQHSSVENAYIRT